MTHFRKLYEPDIRGSVHHSIIHKKIQQNATVYQKFFISYLYEAQHASGHTPPIIRSLKLHWKPLVLHRWRVVGRLVAGRYQVLVEYTLPVAGHCQVEYTLPVAGHCQSIIYLLLDTVR